MTVLVTGATGTLGKELLPRLVSAGHEVHALSRRVHEPEEGVVWFQGDLRTGEGLLQAVQGVKAIVHAATDVFPGGKVRLRRELLLSRKTEVHGTRRLLEQAREAGVEHLIYVSIVGVDQIRAITYLRRKLEAENLVTAGGLPFTIARLTQFHTLEDSLIGYAVRLPFVLPSVRMPHQPIDPGDAAELLIRLLDSGPRNGIVEFGGPEALSSEELLKIWLTARGIRRKIVSLPLLGKSGRALGAGACCCEDKSGKVTWTEWLRANREELR